MKKKHIAIALILIGLGILGYQLYNIFAVPIPSQEEFITLMKAELANSGQAVPAEMTDEMLAQTAAMSIKFGRIFQYIFCILGLILALIGFNIFRKQNLATEATI
ncbi:MAG: hypothetical protein ACOVP5_01490 [Chitinophagales bacterium]